MYGAFSSKACLKRAYDSMFEPNPEYFKLIKELKRREVRKNMAIDYKKEWEKVSNKYGCCGVNIPHEAVSVSLRSIMENQIRKTINKREHLMKEYMKERITTEIDGADKNLHFVNVIRLHKNGNKSLLSRQSVGKKDFEYWCKKKEGR